MSYQNPLARQYALAVLRRAAFGRPREEALAPTEELLQALATTMEPDFDPGPMEVVRDAKTHRVSQIRGPRGSVDFINGTVVDCEGREISTAWGDARKAPAARTPELAIK